MCGFRFKQFAVEQDDVAMKVGTDGVLLGAWAKCEGARRILDIGTGTGVIALQMAQRNTTAQVQAVEIDQAAARRARANFDMSPWAERLQVVQTAVQEFRCDEPYDLIISNPPYFIDSLLSPDGRRSTARHTADLSFEELDAAVCRMLGDDGRFAIVLPTEEFARYYALSRLHLVRKCEVRFVEGGRVRRIMAEFARESRGVVMAEDLAIESLVRGEFTAEYRALTKDFYLKF